MPNKRQQGTRTSQNGGRAQPILGQRSGEIQSAGSFIHLPLGLDQECCQASVSDLNQILADTMTLRDLYLKHHWQVAGPTFYQLHELFEKHYEQQAEVVDSLAERIQNLGGISIAMAHDVAETTRIPRAPRGREEVPAQLARLLEAHEIILTQTREAARQADERGDDGTNDLLISEVLRINEKQVWFVAEHLTAMPLVRTEENTEPSQGTPQEQPEPAGASS